MLHAVKMIHMYSTHATCLHSLHVNDGENVWQLSWMILTSSLFKKMGVHIRLKSRLEIGSDASSIVNFGYHITDDYCNRW